MANTTLVNSKTSTTVILQDNTTSFIDTITPSKETTLVPVPMYTKDSDETDVFDFGGVTKTITITGRYIHGTLATIVTWKESLENLVNGQQDTINGYPITFTDDFEGSRKVKIMSIEFTMDSGNPTQLFYTIKLIESSELA